MGKVLLAMSGGVDSSTAAILLRDAGYEVIGCTMQLWDYTRNPSPDGGPRPGRCCSLDDVYDARRVAERLGFRFYVLNLEKEFERQVIHPFIQSYLGGTTPIPCTLCNTFLKFDRLLDFARQVGVDRVASGHYARLEEESGQFRLKKGRDLRKDQTYYLFELTQPQLRHIEFPVGNFHKSEIRRLAEDQGIPTAAKADSQEICFVSDGDYAGFIERHGGEINEDFLPIIEERGRPGPILFKDGTCLGEHQGLYRYTVGQRRGLRISHPRPLYVLKLDVNRNALIVGYKEDLFSRGLRADKVNWISGRPPSEKIRLKVKIRAAHEERSALVEPLKSESRAEVIFDEPQMAVTRGQAAVFYEGDEVLGGGWISEPIP